MSASTHALSHVPTAEPLLWLEDHGDALLAYALARVGNESLAEDLVQDTFLAALKGHKRFRGEASVRTWLIGILRRRVADYYRRESRRPVPKPTPGDETTESHPCKRFPRDPCEQLEHDEFRRKLDECLEKLPKSIAGVFVLRAMDGVSVKELCNLFGISTTNLRVKLHRARTGLRDCLSKSWV